MDIKKHQVWSKIGPLKKPAHLAKFFLARNLANILPGSNFIGITGSVGKTTTKEACLAVLSQKFKTIASLENIDPIFNIPSTILKIRPNTQKVILEMGIEYPEEMSFYLSLVKPATAIITRISYAHSEFLGNLEQIAKEKSILIKQLPKDGFAILNWDDLNTRKLANETNSQILFYGIDNENCHVWASNIKLEGAGTHFEINYGVERVEVDFKLLGKHFVYSALAAAALGLSCGMTLMNIKRGLEKVESSPHRLQLLPGTGEWHVLDDTYNSSPAALEEALNTLNDLPGRRRILVLGEMKELGAFSKSLHQAIAQRIYKEKIDLVLLGGGDTKYIAEELLSLGFLPEKLEVNLTHQQMVTTILKSAKAGDLILVKGSRAVKLEEVVKRITKNR